MALRAFFRSRAGQDLPPSRPSAGRRRFGAATGAARDEGGDLRSEAERSARRLYPRAATSVRFMVSAVWSATVRAGQRALTCSFSGSGHFGNSHAQKVFTGGKPSTAGADYQVRPRFGWRSRSTMLIGGIGKRWRRRPGCGGPHRLDLAVDRQPSRRCVGLNGGRPSPPRVH
jgi:hypothetical protein